MLSTSLSLDLSRASNKGNITSFLRQHSPSPIDTETIVHSNPDVDIELIKSWLDQGEGRVLLLTKISRKELEQVADKLQAVGLKLRFDWDELSRTAIFRMTSLVHEDPGQWLTSQEDGINQLLRQVARCGRPTAKCSGTARFNVPGVGQHMPDNRIDYLITFNSGSRSTTLSPPFPRVTLEVAYSQSLQNVLNKTCDDLHGSDLHIHASIICDMKYPVGEQKNFKAEISVWTRAWAQNSEDNFPDEISAAVPHPSPAPLPQPLGGQEEAQEQHNDGDSPPLSLSGSETLSSSHSTKVNDECTIWSHKGKSIVRRSEWIVIIDETAEQNGKPCQPTEPFEIALNSWDFMRCCPLHPSVGDLPSFVEIPLPLAPLRQRIIASLAKMREELQNQKSKHVNMADTDASTNPTSTRLPRSWHEPPDMKAFLSRQKRRKLA